MKFKSETPLAPGSVTTEQFPDREGYWIITAMGHAFAVCFRAGSKGKVFEPNFGQGVFPTYADCRAFLAQFTAENEHYAGKEAMLYVKEFSG